MYMTHPTKLTDLVLFKHRWFAYAYKRSNFFRFVFLFTSLQIHASTACILGSKKWMWMHEHVKICEFDVIHMHWWKHKKEPGKQFITNFASLNLWQQQKEKFCNNIFKMMHRESKSETIKKRVVGFLGVEYPWICVCWTFYRHQNCKQTQHHHSIYTHII